VGSCNTGMREYVSVLAARCELTRVSSFLVKHHVTLTHLTMAEY
jgi:hypothetical protein